MSDKKKGEPSSCPMTLSAAMGHSKGKRPGTGEKSDLVFHNVLKNGKSPKKKDPLHIEGVHDVKTRVTIPSKKGK